MNKKRQQQSPQHKMVEDLIDMIKRTSVGKKDSANRDDIRYRFDLHLLEQVYRFFEKKGDEKTFLKVLGITPKRWGKVFALIKQYNNLVAASVRNNKTEDNSFQLFVKLLGDFVDFQVIRPVRQDSSHTYIKFVNPPLECMKEELLFFRSKGDLPAQELQHFANVVESMPQQQLRKVNFILALSNIEEFRKLAKESRYKFVVLSSRSLCEIVLASNSAVEFSVVTTAQLDLLDIQPYRTHGSTPGIMFFGRKREIDWMLNDPGISFAIYGGRQLGKTSLLRKIQEILDEDSAQKTCFVTCEGIQDNLSLGLEILKQLKVNSSSVADVHDFEKILRDFLRTQKSQYTIFIDEIDDLVDIDRNSSHKIFVALRNIHNDFRGKCRFFFAGFKKLYSEFYRLYAPFRNFAEPYELKTVTKRDAQRLIREPLCNRLGIRFLSERDIVDKIYLYTAGHPCFIQHYCKCLIYRIAEDERRIITKEDVEQVYQSEEYRNLILGTFSDNFKEGEADGDLLPKLIICHIIFEELEPFTEAELLASLGNIGIHLEAFHLRSELRKLTMTSVLERNSNLYRFTNSVYPRILQESENLADILIYLIDKAQKNLDKKQNKSQTSREIAEHFVLRAGNADQIIKDSERSYAILGGSGVGKTSLVQTLYQLYESDVSYKSVLIAGSQVKNCEELLSTIMKGFAMAMGSSRENFDILKEFIADENQHGRRLIVLIDESDGLIQNDRSGLKQWIKVCDGLSTEFGEGFRCIITGGSLLHSLLSCKELSKSIEKIELKPLDERGAKHLILRNLKKHENLRLEDDTLTDVICEYTSGNPGLIGKFCEMLYEIKTNPITEDHIEEVGESEEFRMFLLGLYENTWETTQKNIVASIVALNQTKFSIDDIASMGQHEGVCLQQQFERLCLLGCIKRSGRNYKFSNSYYKECYNWRRENM